MQEVERLRADAERWRREVDDLRAAASEADGMRSRVAELEREPLPARELARARERTGRRAGSSCGRREQAQRSV